MIGILYLTFFGMHTDSVHLVLLHSISDLHGSPSKTELILVGDEVGGWEGASDKVGFEVGFNIVGGELGALV